MKGQHVKLSIRTRKPIQPKWVKNKASERLTNLTFALCDLEL